MGGAKCVVYYLIKKHLLSLLGTRHWARQRDTDEGYELLSKHKVRGRHTRKQILRDWEVHSRCQVLVSVPPVGFLI